MPKFVRLALALALAAPVPMAGAAAPVPAAAPGAEPVVPPIPHLPPTEPAAAQKGLRVKKGFHVELAAAEPLVADPVAMSFDENGRLFVAEMRDYPLVAPKPLGRIRLLTDEDGDGKFDHSTIFADGLPWPTAVMWANGGVFVGTTPDILFFKDSNGDGKADERKVLFRGFGDKSPTPNVQGLPNSFTWGLDNRIHGSSGTNGGEVTSALAPGAKPVDLRGKDFAIEPRTWTLTAEDGGGQFGLSFDDWGRKYVCANAHHIMTFAYDGRYAGRNPHFVLPTALVDIPLDGPAAEVYRLSPEEAWRVIRTKWRTDGLVRGPLEGGGRVSGYFTAASGVTIYRGNAFGVGFAGDAFIADSAGNLVHRKKIRPAGPFVVALRPNDEKTFEFVASPDNWFRPVAFANAPDGTLYFADMYREIIEHPTTVPDAIKKQYDLYNGNDRGRIYRIVRDGFRRPPPPRLGSATTAELVKTLAHPNGWHRDTAARLLYERNDPAAVPLLVGLLHASPSALGRLHALHALDGAGALASEEIVRALGDRDASVRRHALALAEQLLGSGSPSDAVWKRLATLARDPSVDVRYQVALTLALVEHPGKTDLLLDILAKDAALEWSRAAVLNALRDGVADVFTRLAGNKTGKPSKTTTMDSGRAALLTELAGLIGARNQGDEVAHVVAFTRESTDTALAFALVRALGDGLARSGSSVAKAGIDLGPLLGRAKALAGDAKAREPERVRAAEALGLARYAEAAPTLLPLLDAAQPEPLQSAAVTTLDRFSDPALAPALLERLPQLAPRTGAQAVTVLLRLPERATTLLNAIAAGQVSRTVLSVVQIQVLRQSSNKDLSTLARKVLAVSQSPRGEVLKRFARAIELGGDRAHGKILFEQRCVSCHRLGKTGNPLGPDLVAAKAAGREALLNSILDPNREVPTQYLAYAIETKDGAMLVGLVGAETPTTVTLRQAFGVTTPVPRAQIKSMRGQGTSLMPEGLEEGLAPQDLADLLDFITSAGDSSGAAAKRP